MKQKILLDQHFKNILRNKLILAYIMKDNLDEYANSSIGEIMKCIEPQGDVPLHTHLISGHRNENNDDEQREVHKRERASEARRQELGRPHEAELVVLKRCDNPLAGVCSVCEVAVGRRVLAARRGFLGHLSPSFCLRTNPSVCGGVVSELCLAGEVSRSPVS